MSPRLVYPSLHAIPAILFLKKLSQALSRKNLGQFKTVSINVCRWPLNIDAYIVGKYAIQYLIYELNESIIFEKGVIERHKRHRTASYTCRCSVSSI